MLVSKLGLSGGIFMSFCKIKKLFSNAARAVTAVLLCLAALSGCSLPNSQSNPPKALSSVVFEELEPVSLPDGISARAAVLIEASTGRVIASKKRRPAYADGVDN